MVHPRSKDVFEGKGQPWRLGKFFGDVKFAVGDHGEGFEKELEGAVLQPALKVDRFVTPELMNNLFNSKKWSQSKKKSLKGYSKTCTTCLRRHRSILHLAHARHSS